MSIAPFLPGIPASLPDTGTTPEGSADGAPADGQPAFGDALLAALAGALAVPAASQPVVTSVAAAATKPATPLPAAPRELGVPTAELGVPTVELGVPTVELGIPTTELGVPTRDRIAVANSVAATGGQWASLLPTESVASPGTGFSSSQDRSGDATPAAVVPAPVDGTRPVDARPDDSPAPLESSADLRVGPTVATANSVVATPNSVVATPNSAVTTPNSAVSRAVVQQVFPEVTRLASSAGNGSHRITLTLQPEQLGEVRVTLVVRDGSVHVRLAGGDGVEGAAVHRALAGGAPELQRLLERTGAEARVSVRDPFAPLLPTASASAATPAAASQVTAPGGTGQPGLQTGPESQAHPDGRARGEQSAREQPAREEPRRQEPRRPSYVIEPTPVTGRLDRTV